MKLLVYLSALLLFLQSCGSEESKAEKGSPFLGWGGVDIAEGEEEEGDNIEITKKCNHIKPMNKSNLVIMLFLVAGCSDKYDSFKRVSVPPIIVTNKDSMNIRIKDYSGYYAGNGLLRISAKDTLAKGLHFFAEDSTGNLEIYYDSATVQGPLPLNQPAWLYVACKSPGLYTLKVSIYDQLGQNSTKRIPVRVWPNEAPVASFRMDLIEQGNGFAVYDIVSTSTTRMSKIVEYIFFVNNIATPIYQPKMRVTLYSGTNKIGLQVKDDLGLTSTIKEEQKIIP